MSKQGRKTNYGNKIFNSPKLSLYVFTSYQFLYFSGSRYWYSYIYNYKGQSWSSRVFHSFLGRIFRFPRQNSKGRQNVALFESLHGKPRDILVAWNWRSFGVLLINVQFMFVQFVLNIQMEIWCLIIVTVFLTSFLIKCSDQCYKNNCDGEITTKYYILYTFACIVNQGKCAWKLKFYYAIIIKYLY